jgi:ribosomal protein L11 methylase PrmA
MFVWRKRASAVWLAANEATLRKVAGQQLAIISRLGRKNAIAEIAGSSQRDLEKIRTRFRGKVEKLSRDWLKKLLRWQKSEPIKIGNQLTIFQSSTNRSRNENTSLLIPAGAAFGTGEHTTTATALRLLERCTRFWEAQAANRRRLSKEGSAGSRTQQASSLRLRFPKTE